MRFPDGEGTAAAGGGTRTARRARLRRRFDGVFGSGTGPARRRGKGALRQRRCVRGRCRRRDAPRGERQLHVWERRPVRGLARRRAAGHRHDGLPRRRHLRRRVGGRAAARRGLARFADGGGAYDGAFVDGAIRGAGLDDAGGRAARHLEAASTRSASKDVRRRRCAAKGGGGVGGGAGVRARARPRRARGEEGEGDAQVDHGRALRGRAVGVSSAVISR